MYINKNAKEIFRREGVNDKGEDVKVVMWEGYTGMRSGRSDLTRWVRVWIDGEQTFKRRFTGKNLNHPIDFQKECIECII